MATLELRFTCCLPVVMDGLNKGLIKHCWHVYALVSSSNSFLNLKIFWIEGTTEGWMDGWTKVLTQILQPGFKAKYKSSMTAKLLCQRLTRDLHS